MKSFVLMVLIASPAEGTELAVTLLSCEESSLRASNQYKSAALSAEAAAAAASASGAAAYPRLSLEGNLRYNEVVPAISMPAALGGGRPLGDNWNYSLGPSVSWTLFDGGVLRHGRRSSEQLARARSAEAEHVRRQVVLKARTAYFQLQLALRHMPQPSAAVAEVAADAKPRSKRPGRRPGKPVHAH